MRYNDKCYISSVNLKTNGGLNPSNNKHIFNAHLAETKMKNKPIYLQFTIS